MLIDVFQMRIFFLSDLDYSEVLFGAINYEEKIVRIVELEKKHPKVIGFIPFNAIRKVELLEHIGLWE